MDLFAGTRSIGKAFEERGHEVYSIEWDEKFEGIDWYVDIFEVTAEDILERFGQPDVIWASPPCEKFSVAAIGKHWYKGTNKPKTPETKKALELLEHTIKLIEDLSPKYFFIENPRGKMRKVDPVQHLPRYTVTYCQYYNRDDYPDLTDEEAENMRRMKPTVFGRIIRILSLSQRVKMVILVTFQHPEEQEQELKDLEPHCKGLEFHINYVYM